MPAGTVVAGVTRPPLAIAAQAGVAELQRTFPVKSRVEPSLKVPVADICRVCTGLEVRVGVWGPIANVDRVGLTKKPEHPTAMASRKSRLAGRSLRLELRILKPLNEGLHNVPESALKIVAE